MSEENHSHGDEKDKHHVTIRVNTVPKHVDGDMISFEQLIDLAFETPPTGPNVLFTITYTKGPKEAREGELSPGQVIKITNGEAFNVTCTDRS